MRPRLHVLLPFLLVGCSGWPLQNDRAPDEVSESARRHALEDLTVLGDANYPALLHRAGLTDQLHAANPLVEHTLISDAAGEEAAAPEDLWERIRRGYALPEQSHARIQAQLAWYAKHPAYMNRVAERATPYLFHIVERLEARGMPAEIAMLPIVESAFHPFAYSHGRAAGIWQFIPGTGKMFGLKQNWWYDGRRDIYASTEAALEYLDRLQRRFDGDWMLALAAYNSGGGTVSRAITKNRRLGKPTDYWSLDLPRETEGYVPKLLALKSLVGDPAAHGLELLPIPDEPYFTKVEIDSQIDLALAAELSGLELDEIYRLNPGFNRWATDPDGPHYLLLPLDRAAEFEERLAQVDPKDRISWQVHKVRTGETLGGIARKHKTTVATLKRVNKLRNHVIRAGANLLIPVASKSASSYSLSADQRKRAVQNREQKGQKLVHIVRPGDTLWDLSRRHEVGVSQLARWNAMAPRDPLTPGQRLVIWTRSQTQAVSGPARRAVTQKLGYVVRRGDSLYRISNRFKVTVAQLRKWNNLPAGGYLQPGQRLTLYVDVISQSGS